MTEKKAKIVFISSPYAGNNAETVRVNVEFAKAACLYAAQKGCTFFAPHLLYPQLFRDDDTAGREKGLAMGMDFLPFCEELWVCGSVISPGMAIEIERAKSLGVRVRNVSAEKILGLTAAHISPAVGPGICPAQNPNRLE